MAQCKENGISIVKLNGKDTGFVCMEASLTSGEVNVCLVPEMDFELYGTKGLLNYILNYVKKHKYFLLAVASGAG
jgi:6-phosphofructokinase 1